MIAWSLKRALQEFGLWKRCERFQFASTAVVLSRLFISLAYCICQISIRIWSSHCVNTYILISALHVKIFFSSLLFGILRIKIWKRNWRKWDHEGLECGSTARVFSLQALWETRIVQVFRLHCEIGSNGSVLGLRWCPVAQSVVPVHDVFASQTAVEAWCLCNCNCRWTFSNLYIFSFLCMYNIFRYFVLPLRAHVHTYFHTPRTNLLFFSSEFSESIKWRNWYYKSLQFASTARVFSLQALRETGNARVFSLQALRKFTVCKHCTARDCGFARVLFRFVNFSFCTTAVVRCAATRWFLLAARGWRDRLLAAEHAPLCRKWECMYNIYNFIVMTLHAHVHTYFHTPRKILLLLSSRISVSNSENMTYESVQALWETGIARIFSLQALREFTVCKHCAALHCAGSSQTHADGRCCCHVSTSSGGKSALNVC